MKTTSEIAIQITVTPTRKTMSAVRWGYLLPRAVLLFVFWGVMTFLVDPVLHYTATHTATSVLQTPVGIDSLKSHLWQGKIEFAGLQIADRDRSGTNALEIAQGHLQLDRRALARKKFIINSGELTGIQCQTLSRLASADEKQQQSGAWEFSREAVAIGRLAGTAGQQLLETLKQTALSQLDPAQLETIKLARVKEEKWNERFARYQSQGKIYEQRLEQLQQQLEGLKKGNPLDHLQRSIEFASEIEEIKNEATAIKQELAGLGPQLATDFRELEEARKRDLERVQYQLTQIPLNQEELTLALVGPEMARRFEELAEWSAFIRRATSLANEDFEPERAGGQVIVFDQQQEFPNFLLRQFLLSGQFQIQGQSAPFRLQLYDWTAEVDRFQKPGRFELAFDYQGAHQINGSVDRTGESPHLVVHGQLRKCPTSSRTLGHRDTVHVLFSPGWLSGDYQITLNGSQIEGSIHWNQTDVNIDVQQLRAVPAGSAFQLVSLRQVKQPEIETKLEEQIKETFELGLMQLLEESFSGLHQIDGQLQISGTVEQPEWQLHSAAGLQVGRTLKSSFQKMAEQHKTATFHQATAAINQELSQLTHKIDDQYKLVVGKLNVQELAAGQLLKQVAERPQTDLLKKLFR